MGRNNNRSNKANNKEPAGIDQGSSTKHMRSMDELLDDVAGLNKESVPVPEPEPESYLDSVLRKAEGLLKNVENATTIAVDKSPSSSSSSSSSSSTLTEDSQVNNKAKFIGERLLKI